MTPATITHQQWEILRTLMAAQSPLRAADIAEKTGAALGSVAVQIRFLRMKGYPIASVGANFGHRGYLYAGGVSCPLCGQPSTAALQETSPGEAK